MIVSMCCERRGMTRGLGHGDDGNIFNFLSLIGGGTMVHSYVRNRHLRQSLENTAAKLP